jgi:hypothetical protein
VLFIANLPNFYVHVYSSASSAWKAATGVLNWIVVPHQRPSVVAGDIVYRLEFDEKYIMAVDATKLTVSVFPVPNAGMLLYAGNHCIGKTEDGRLCYFAIREPLLLVKWVLEAPRRWAPQEQVALRPLMNLATIGPNLHGESKLSASFADQLHLCNLISFGGFCEGGGTLFFIMADKVVSLDLKTFRMEILWHDSERCLLGHVFPYEMVAWPPAINDSI